MIDSCTKNQATWITPDTEVSSHVLCQSMNHILLFVYGVTVLYMYPSFVPEYESHYIICLRCYCLVYVSMFCARVWITLYYLFKVLLSNICVHDLCQSMNHIISFVCVLCLSRLCIHQIYHLETKSTFVYVYKSMNDLTHLCHEVNNLIHNPYISLIIYGSDWLKWVT